MAQSRSVGTPVYPVEAGNAGTRTVRESVPPVLRVWQSGFPATRIYLDRETGLLQIMEFVRSHPHRGFEEAEIKRQTGVAKSRVRRLVRGVSGIDPSKLEKGVVSYSPPSDPSATASSAAMTSDRDTT